MLELRRSTAASTSCRSPSRARPGVMVRECSPTLSGVPETWNSGPGLLSARRMQGVTAHAIGLSICQCTDQKARQARDPSRLIAHRRSRPMDAFIHKHSKRLPAKSADEIEAKFKAQDERAARYDAMEQQLKALTTMMQAVARMGRPNEQGGFDADKAVVAQLATPVIYNELTKKMPVRTRNRRACWRSTRRTRPTGAGGAHRQQRRNPGVVAEAMARRATTSRGSAPCKGQADDHSRRIRDPRPTPSSTASRDREMTQCQHVIASGAARDVRCATSLR